MEGLFDTALGYWNDLWDTADDVTEKASSAVDTANGVLQNVQNVQSAFENGTLNQSEAKKEEQKVSTGTATANMKTADIIGGAAVGVVLLVLLLRK